MIKSVGIRLFLAAVAALNVQWYQQHRDSVLLHNLCIIHVLVAAAKTLIY